MAGIAKHPLMTFMAMTAILVAGCASGDEANQPEPPTEPEQDPWTWLEIDEELPMPIAANVCPYANPLSCVSVTLDGAPTWFVNVTGIGAWHVNATITWESVTDQELEVRATAYRSCGPTCHVYVPTDGDYYRMTGTSPLVVDAPIRGDAQEAEGLYIRAFLPEDTVGIPASAFIGDTARLTGSIGMLEAARHPS